MRAESTPDDPSNRRSGAWHDTVPKLAVAAAIIAVGLGVSIWWFALRPETPRIDADDAAQVALGQGVYQAQCARCHGANLEGQPNWRERLVNGRLPAPPHDDSGHSWHHPDEQLFGITKYGLGPYAPAGYESDMPAFEGALTDGEIAAVLAFIKSRWSAANRQRQEHVTAQSQR